MKFQTKIANASFTGPRSSSFKDQTPIPDALVLPSYIHSQHEISHSAESLAKKNMLGFLSLGSRQDTELKSSLQV